MPKSMTAFSRTDISGEFGSLVVELKSVNHRFIEINFKIPDALKQLEVELRNFIKQELTRGKIECIITIHESENLPDIALNEAQIRKYLGSIHQLKNEIKDSAPISITDFLKLPGVLIEKHPKLENVRDLIIKGFRDAISKLIDYRDIEGKKLKKDILIKINTIETQIAYLEKELPKLLELNRKRLKKRADELAIQIDRDRLDQEMVILANRSDIDEEIVRMRSHTSEVKRLLGTDKSIGRKLDFLMQEMNREANTLGSKSLSDVTSGAAIELKVLIEQIREQVQNIE
jgi:uncharacterized protein (TIGR00255 family)